MRRKLAESVRHLCEVVRSTPDPRDVDEASLTDSIASHRQPPGVFARYFETVYALAGGRADEAGRLLDEMAVMARKEPRFEVRALSQASMGDDAAHYVRLLNAGEHRSIFVAREPRHWDDFELRVQQALTLIEAADPPLAAEIRALIVQVVGAEARDPAHSFGSVSSLTLWGAATINLESHRTVLDVASALVHEAAHLILFAYAIAEPLVANPDCDRFVSPLRPDPRPMDGVFHATFVCARLFYFYSALARRRPARLAADDLATLEDALSHLAARFDDGEETIRAHGRLTACGQQIFNSTQDFMSHAAA